MQCRGEESLEWIPRRLFLMVIFTLCIKEYNVIDGIVQRKSKKRFQFQFYKETLQSMLLGGDGGKWEGGFQGSEVYGYLVAWRYLPYACSTLETKM